MLPETLSLLREHDFIRGEESVNRDALADAIVELLVADPVTEEAEIETTALIMPELRFRVFGDVDSEEIEDELDEVIRPLVGGEGKVQAKLPGELVLCSTPVPRRLSSNGGTITLHKRGCFVTADPDLIVDYYWRPQSKAAQSAVRKLNNRIELGMKRQPLTTPKRRELVVDTHTQIRLELPMGDEAA
jgi:hypothetical protein